MRTLAAARVAIASPLLAAIRIAGIAAVSILLAGQTESEKRAPKSGRSATGTATYTLAWGPALQERVRSCWNVSASLRAAAPVRIRIYFELRRDGTLAGPPRQVPGTSDGGHPALVQSAISAVEKCQPYSFLPQSEYVGGWDRLDITFDTKTSTEPKPRSDASATPGDAGQMPKWLSIMQPERKR